jgi:hypothetical protein
MATNKQSVIVDSSALISLTNLHDTLHGQYGSRISRCELGEGDWRALM